MKTYLTEDEISAYCGLISGVKMEHIEAATTLIDAYKGRSFFPMEHTERVELKHNRVDHEFRGKLKHFPRVSIEKITTKAHSCFGNDVLTLDAHLTLTMMNPCISPLNFLSRLCFVNLQRLSR